MSVIVQKYGGTSVAKIENRRQMYEKIKKAYENNNKLVVVVSAMGRKGEPYATDTLLDCYSKEKILPNNREQDMIYACGEIISGSIIANELREIGYKTILLTGGQAGILTDRNFSNAAIINVNTDYIEELLNNGYLVIVTGGQGASERGEVTSIGRGGSDVSACAIGAAISAEEVVIYTDVDGIMTADPRIIDNTRIIDEIDYDFCELLAKNGAKVIHPRSIEMCKKNKNVKLYVRSTFSDCDGTYICRHNYKNNEIVGITMFKERTVFNLNGLQDEVVVAYMKKNNVHYDDYVFYDDVGNRFFVTSDDIANKYVAHSEFMPLIKEKTSLVAISIVGNYTDNSTKDLIIKLVGKDGIYLFCKEQVITVFVEQSKLIDILAKLHSKLCVK